jgi:hypothetical protein
MSLIFGDCRDADDTLVRGGAGVHLTVSAFNCHKFFCGDKSSSHSSDMAVMFKSCLPSEVASLELRKMLADLLGELLLNGFSIDF